VSETARGVLTPCKRGNSRSIVASIVEHPTRCEPCLRPLLATIKSVLSFRPGCTGPLVTF
jgi:hypothetical protein